MTKIAAGIVLYNPEIQLLKQNVDSIYPQVDYIVMVDNGSTNINDVYKMINKRKNVFIVTNEMNKGIASALNKIINFCDKNGSKWVITLDQDSVCPYNLINTYKEYINFEKVGIITLPIVDRNNMNEKVVSNGAKYEIVDKCITSASLTNIEICKKINLFDEKMFIDLVDFEYCIRLRKSGYKILKINEVFLLHQLGQLELHKFGNKTIHVGNHNSMRKYYYIRNSIYCHKKHGKFFSIKITFYTIFISIFKVLMYENNKMAKIEAIFNGIIDGIKMKP